jgi:hypothetical protein
MGMVVEYNMNTAVNMDGIRRKVEPRKRVMKHRRLFREGVPVGLGDAIACSTTMDCGEVEWAMDASVFNFTGRACTPTSRGCAKHGCVQGIP